MDMFHFFKLLFGLILIILGIMCFIGALIEGELQPAFTCLVGFGIIGYVLVKDSYNELSK